jgi:adenylylsulfate kinase-like enzyme
LTVRSKAIAHALETHLDRLKAELKALDGGKVRHAVRLNDGPWIDKTEETIHDKRNLVATLEAIKKVVSNI